MRHEVQIHFENGGQIVFHMNFTHQDQFWEQFVEDAFNRFHDQDLNRIVIFDAAKVTAIFIQEKPSTDPYERIYATEERNIP